MTEVEKILIERDGMTEGEANDALMNARNAVFEDGMDPEEVLLNDFGLEPDYIFDLIG